MAYGRSGAPKNWVMLSNASLSIVPKSFTITVYIPYFKTSYMPITVRKYYIKDCSLL